MGSIVSQVCSLELEGNSALQTLSHDKQAKAPLLPEVGKNDLIATAVW
jgi:hypothetical protein